MRLDSRNVDKQPFGVDTTPTNAREQVTKTRKFYVPALIVLALIALVGVIGMIWNIIVSTQKSEQIAALQAELDVYIEEDVNTDKLLDNIQDEALSDDSANEVKDEALTIYSPYILDDYFYIPNWDVKFKLSDSLTDYGYAVAQNSLSNSFGEYEVGVSAVLKADLLQNPQTRYYDDIFICSIVSLSMIPADDQRIFTVPSDVEWAKVVNFRNDAFVIYNYRASSCVFNYNIDQVSEELMEVFSHPESI